MNLAPKTNNCPISPISVLLNELGHWGNDFGFRDEFLRRYLDAQVTSITFQFWFILSDCAHGASVFTSQFHSQTLCGREFAVITIKSKLEVQNQLLFVRLKKSIKISDIYFQGIHQNGGFTKVWFAMKTFLTPSILIIMVWYWRRITLMTRPPVLLEK